MPWEADQVHVWPSQHQDSGGTRLVSKTVVSETNYKHPVLKRKSSVPILGIDHGEGLTVECETTTRYISGYLGTLRRLLSRVDHEYVWVVNSVCDYRDFDFTWHPSEWQQDMLHVFASSDGGSVEAFGDTFYIHVPGFLEKSKNIRLLEWFETICFQGEITVPRRPIPQIQHTDDTQVIAVWTHEFASPYALFTNNKIEGPYPVPNLWREETKTIVPLSPGASSCLVPREAKTYLRTQLYDYPNIDRKNQHMYTDQLLDLVFIDNGEPNAEHNYQKLKYRVGNTCQVHRSSGVNGRVAAYQAAARLSTTPWFFAVFAKLEVTSVFDWTWQPDRLQEPKHYIFHAFNPVNNLTYGHQAMIAYNKQLVLANTGQGLDFTLDQPHEVVPLLSGTAMYYTSAWIAWRTAFREALKLRASLPDVENEYRLNQWLTVNTQGKLGEHSCFGAQDAMEFYDQVNGDFDQLKKSYDWAWLASYALIKRNLTPNQ